MNNAEIKQVLIKARELITKPENWTQKAEARAVDGRRVPPLSTEAVCYCAIGALLKAAPLYLGSRHIDALSSAIQDSVVYYNDHHTHAEVVAMFDKAIELAN